MSALMHTVANTVHQWFMENMASCDGHPAEPDFIPECEQLAARIVADIDWSELDR